MHPFDLPTDSRPQDRDSLWGDLLEVVPPGWYVGQPNYHDERREWQLYAFDTTQRPTVGRHIREWTAVHPTEEGVIREMGRCLRELAAWRTPK